MKDIVQDLLEYIRNTNTEGRERWGRFSFPPAPTAFLNAVYNFGIWDGDHLEKRETLLKADISILSLADIFSCFTAIIATERCFNGFYEQCAYDGILEKLLVRYLDLTKNKVSNDRAFYHALLGLAVADAVGVPAEFKSRASLRQNPITDMTAYGTHNQPMGTWSDDTSMALCLAYSLKEKNAFDAEDVMKRFAAWLGDGAYTPHGVCFDCGNTCAKAIRAYGNGTPIDQCGGRDEYANGNGSLMRILPILPEVLRIAKSAPWYSDEAMELIHDVSALTHAHPLSQSACGVYLCIAACLLNGETIADAVKKGTEGALWWYRNHNGFSSAKRWNAFADPAAFAATKEQDIGSSGFVADTLTAALWCLLNTDNYRDCVLKAVNLGEDTDTTAAVAGGLAGLVYGCGEKGIPIEWINQLQALDMIQGACNETL